MIDEFSEFKREEEARRERNWDARERWRILQETIAWAESQATARRNERLARLREQARKLEWLRQFQKPE